MKPKWQRTPSQKGVDDIYDARETVRKAMKRLCRLPKLGVGPQQSPEQDRMCADLSNAEQALTDALIRWKNVHRPAPDYDV